MLTAIISLIFLYISQFPMDDTAFLIWLVSFFVGIFICIHADIFIFALLLEALDQSVRTVFLLLVLCILIIVFIRSNKRKRSLQEKQQESFDNERPE